MMEEDYVDPAGGKPDGEDGDVGQARKAGEVRLREGDRR